MPVFLPSPACVLRVITRINHTGRHEVEDVLLREEAYDLICDGQTVARMHCMPADLEELAVGRLFTLGLLRDARQISSLTIRHPAGQNPDRTPHQSPRLAAENAHGLDPLACASAAATALEAATASETSTTSAASAAEPPCAPADQRAAPLPSLKLRAAGSILVRLAPPPAPETEAQQADVRLDAAQVHSLQAAFEERCALFRQTGAAHSCALADPEGILLFYEDIARHNALDKLIGAMQLQGVPPHGKLMIFSGRLAVDMLEKAAVSGVRLLMAPGAPSLASVELAEAMRISLLGFVRKDNINIYTCPHRVV
ncbi:formate dehydrogenase accessory sulfurtransferase FdhD [Desulfovibrio sp. 86]|uniref:Sulfur carrier protein FdhD n=1 Tax=uncultured Desulfovibrio sp. TaxID=167968 RepID=A0A212LAG7_9BACT|nr:formate dehydrogenase accessory sulfurtransferase FdhD [Desulfovibrio sp. 86]SCM74561.1 Formate dehydrogenase family accessory protein FdhD [uncultured Desulfovibrio sp.]VZH34908.1 Sulfur carrier protein FdhD [Desulfovibrio sp. 86]